MGTLYVVATPIGNLDDISKRGIDTLSNVDLVIAEDTRVGAKLLSHLGIKKPIESYHQHSGDEKKLLILKRLMDGEDIALISDAGTPGVSDPGNELIEFLYGHLDVKIVPIPGPSAISTALSICGFDVVPHIFLGFWPKKKANKTLDIIESANIPFVYFDSPYRVVKNLELIQERLGTDKRVFVGRELTKMHETHYRGEIGKVISSLQEEKHLKGEIVVIIS